MTPYPHIAKNYAFDQVSGLSRSALDLHLDLYCGHVEQVNFLLQESVTLAEAVTFGNAERLRSAGLMQRLTFELNGMALHELFFEQLNGPPPVSEPVRSGLFAQAVKASFHDIAAWRRDVSRLALTRGIGWVITFRQAAGTRLINLWIAEHHLAVPTGLQPIAAFDLWEHAYLPDCPTANRGAYMEILFRNLDWSILDRRLQTPLPGIHLQTGA